MIFQFHQHDTASNKTMLPAYYLETDYDPINVRIYAGAVPIREAQFDILYNGVSIFSNRNNDQIDISTGVRTVPEPLTTAVLEQGQHTAELAGELKEETLYAGGWLTGYVVDAGGARDIMVQLSAE